MEPSWARLGSLQGSTGGIFRPGGFKHLESRKQTPKYSLLESSFLKQPLLFLRYFFHHGRLPPQRWVQGRVRPVGMKTSSLLVGFFAGKGLLLPAAMTQSNLWSEVA